MVSPFNFRSEKRISKSRSNAEHTHPICWKYNAEAIPVSPPRNAIEMPNGNEPTNIKRFRDFISLFATIQDAFISFGSTYEINVRDFKNWFVDMMSDFQSFLDKLKFQYGVKTWYMKPNRIIVEFESFSRLHKHYQNCWEKHWIE